MEQFTKGTITYHVYRDYIYTKGDTRTNGRTYHRCIVKNCGGTGVSEKGTFEPNRYHSHKPCVEKVAGIRFHCKLVERVKSSNTPYLQIYLEEAERNPIGAAVCGDYIKLRRSMANYRVKFRDERIKRAFEESCCEPLDLSVKRRRLD